MATRNILHQLENAVTDGGGDGIIVRNPLPLRDFHLQSSGAALTTTLTTNPGWDKVDTNLTVLSWAAGVVVEAGYHLHIPTDYDQSLDELKIRFRAEMAGSTDTPSLDVKAWKDSARGTDLNPTKSAALSDTDAWVEVDLSGNDLTDDEGLQLAIFPEAHSTDAVHLLAMEMEYRSTIVPCDFADRS